jgi:integrase
MASVNKDARGRSPFWYACYTTADGVRKRVSTELTDKRAAEKVVLALQRAEDERRKGTISTQRIVDLLNDTLRSAGLEKIETIRVGAWLKRWLESKRNISQASRIGYQQALREFLEFLGTARSNAALDSITEKDIEAFVDHLRKDGRSAGTINKLVRKYLSGAFEKARKLGKIGYNPIAATDPLQHEGIVKERFLPEQVSQLVAAAKTDPDWQGAILFAYGSGSRLQDVANLRSSNLHIEDRVATFVERKGKRIKKNPVVVGLHADFLDWLSSRPITSDDPLAYLFPSLANRSGAGRNGLSKAFERLMDRAGITSPVIKTGTGKKGRSVRALSFHSFRHGAASAVFNSQAIKEMQRRVTQHSARSGVLERYTHSDLDLVHQAVAAIPRLPKND